MDYSSFLEDQIRLQEKEVNASGRIKIILLLVAILIILICIYAYFKLHVTTNVEWMGLGSGIITGGWSIIPRGDTVKRREKLSALKTLKMQVPHIDDLPPKDKDFILALLEKMFSDSVTKI
jgi:hypothetical protein